MAMEVSCPKCGQTYRFAVDNIGKKFQCSACQQAFMIGQPSERSLEPPSIQVPTKSKSKSIPARISGSGFNSLATSSRRPGLFKILFDFGLKHYYTPWVLRSSWTFAVVLYFLSVIVAIALFIAKVVDSAQVQENFAFLSDRSTGFVLLGLFLIELILLCALLSYRTILELIIVVFDISETLKADSGRR